MATWGFARIVVGFVVAALALPCAWAPLAALQDDKPATGRDCRDDSGTDRCSAEARERAHARYAIASPDEMLAEGATVRRALFVDGYGRDVAAVTFVRRRGAGPRVEIAVPQDGDAAEAAPLSAPIDDTTWSRVLRASAYFDRTLVDRPGEDGVICLHGWMATGEGVDAPRVNQNVVAGTGSEGLARDPSLPVQAPMTEGITRTATQSACEDGLVLTYAFELARIALAALPQCATLDVRDFRNEATLLAACARLRGDRLVAGEAYALGSRIQRALASDAASPPADLFVGLGPTRAKLFAEATRGASVYLDPPIGIDSDHARIDATLVFRDGGDTTRTERLTLNLLRQTGRFVIDTFAVSDTRPAD